MPNAEIIGLLCAGSTRYHEYGARNSSMDKLSRSELAGFLSGLDRVSMNLVLAKYACNIDAERMLIAQVRVWAAGLSIREHWKIIKGMPSLSNMSAMATFEVVRPNRCNRCYGRCVIVNKVCPKCGGSGYHHLSGNKIAEAIGVDSKNYQRTWKTRYENTIKYLQDIDCIVLTKLRNSEFKCNEKKVIATAPKLQYIFPQSHRSHA